MSPKPVIARERARRDVEEAIEHFLAEASEQIAGRFIDELERAYRHIAGQPATGSTRYAHELDLPGLRAWPLRHYPYLIFYIERHDHVDVWRVLHGRRDIPGWLGTVGDDLVE